MFYFNLYILEDPFLNSSFLRTTNCFAWNPRKLPWKSAKLFSLNRLQFGKPLHSCRGRRCTFLVLWPMHGFLLIDWLVIWLWLYCISLHRDQWNTVIIINDLFSIVIRSSLYWNNPGTLFSKTTKLDSLLPKTVTKYIVKIFLWILRVEKII